jgi:hypothetical protein
METLNHLIILDALSMAGADDFGEHVRLYDDGLGYPWAGEPRCFAVICDSLADLVTFAAAVGVASVNRTGEQPTWITGMRTEILNLGRDIVAYWPNVAAQR